MSTNSSTSFHKIHNYYIGSPISTTDFSSVRLAFSALSSKPLIAKIISKRKLKNLHESDSVIFAETVLYPSLSHPNIVPVLDVITTEHLFILIMDQFNHFSNFTEKQKLTILSDVLSAVEYLHKNYIAHRDIKLQNIVFSDNGHAKLIDFGFSKICLSKISGKAGSFGYCAPEVFSGEKYDPFKADMWSIGV